MSKNIYRVGAGRNRDYWGIKNWMDKHNITNAAIAKAVGVHQSTVSQTVRGQRNQRKVLGYLKAAGCPATVLSLPADLKR